jgi:hypothetical protein
VMMQGLPPRGGVRKKHGTNVRVDGQKPDIRRQCRTSGQLTAKFISIKGAKRRSGGCAQKAAELTPGDLLRVASATEAAERQPDHGAEVSRGHIRS